MFKFGRHFSIVGLLGVVFVILGLFWPFRYFSFNAIADEETRANEALTRAFSEYVWLGHGSFLAAANQLDAEGLLNDPRLAVLDQDIHEHIKAINVVKAKIYSVTGRTLYSTERQQINESLSGNRGLQQALSGVVTSTLAYGSERYEFEPRVTDRDFLSSYVPYRHVPSGPVEVVFELYTDMTPLADKVNGLHWRLVGSMVMALLGLYVVLAVIMSRADQRMRQAEAKQAAETQRMAYRNFHDELTKLPNRQLFLVELDNALKRAKRLKKPFGLMILDLDRFKVINDSLGHDLGDRVLALAAERLGLAVRETDTAFRIGGDEFAVLLEYMRDDQDAALVAGRIIEALSAPFELGQQEIISTTSLGVTVYPRDAQTADRLIKDAEAAMYQAKASGRNRFQFYAPAMNAKAEERLALETSLRKALKENEFVLYYQPKVAVESNKVVGMEALLRWRHPLRGVLAPDQFLSALEETGLIAPVGEWVMRQACVDAKRWIDDGLPPLRVSVNVSSLQFRSALLVDQVAAALKDSGLPPNMLELELTETLLVDSRDQAVQLLHRLKELGVLISIDDFGTGYSSLSYLRDFPVDFLKIDRSFIRDLARNPKDAAITSAITSLAHSLSLGVVAEGVENPEQLEFLRGRGCQQIQGYMVSKPVPIEEIANVVRSWELADTGK